MFHPFEPEVSLNAKESVFSLFLLSDALALKSRAHCQMGKRLHGQKERAESIRKWQLFSCARGAGQLPGLVAKVTGSSANVVQRAAVGSDGGRAEDDGWDVGQEKRELVGEGDAV